MLVTRELDLRADRDERSANCNSGPGRSWKGDPRFALAGKDFLGVADK